MYIVVQSIRQRKSHVILFARLRNSGTQAGKTRHGGPRKKLSHGSKVNKVRVVDTLEKGFLNVVPT